MFGVGYHGHSRWQWVLIEIEGACRTQIKTIGGMEIATLECMSTARAIGEIVVALQRDGNGWIQVTNVKWISLIIGG